MWHPGGYGGLSVSECVTVDGMKDAMAFAWNGDNRGPGNVSFVASIFINF
jgi:hypothetical protein